MIRFDWSRGTRHPLGWRRQGVRLLLECLEDRCTPAALLSGVPTPPLTPEQPIEGTPFSDLPFAVVVDSDTSVLPSDFTVSIDWGDGSALDTTTGTVTAVPSTPGQYTISGSHTYTEEAGSVVPPSSFPVTLTVTDTKNNVTTTVTSDAFVADAGLSQGNPVTGTPKTFSAIGTSATTSTLASFETAIGGVKNTATSPQGSGFRTITWDGVATNGTDQGGPPNTTVIDSKTVGIPLNRFQGNGVFFGAVYATAGADANGDTFATVNPSVKGLFHPFSTANTFAMFNDNGIDFKFIAPSSTTSTPVPAASRGFGAVFVNVEIADTTTIQYFNGNTLLDTESAPVGGKGQPVFVGALFNNPIVTRVVLTLGTDVIFNFDGSTITPGSAVDDGTTHNLVVTDDWAFAEPVATPNGLPIVSGPQGTAFGTPLIKPDRNVPFTGTAGTFSDLDPQGKATDFTATINWGDGSTTNGTIASNGKGGFDVIGTHTYLTAGTFNLTVDVADFGGGPGFAGAVPTLSITNLAQVGGKPSTVGAFDPTTGTWFLDPANAPGAPSPAAFGYGAAGFKPVLGDWNNDGVDTLGVLDPASGTWFLRNENNAGSPDAGQFSFGVGIPGGVPVAGDWNGTGKTGIGIYDEATGTWFLRSTPDAGAADVGTFSFGLPGWIPVVGDWTGTGKTGIGVYDPTTATWFLRSSASAGPADVGFFTFGAPGFLPVVGDWTGTGNTGIGVFDKGTWSLRSEPNGGLADAASFAFGVGGWLPVAGTQTLPPEALMAASGQGTGATGLLTDAELQGMVGAALQRLASVGTDPTLLHQLASAQYVVGAVPVGTLALTYPTQDRVVFSANAAGYGWFDDPTPGQDEEYSGGVALPGTAAAGHMDLLSTVLHEMGHLAGLPDSGTGLMEATLSAGTRQMGDLDAFFSSAPLAAPLPGTTSTPPLI